jgi:SAM-dependent methyltransferase
VCGSRERSVWYDHLQDRLFARAPGRWTLCRCHGCGSGYLDPRPDSASIGRAYGGYYTHDEISAQQAPLRRWKLALRNGYLNSRYGYSERPAIPLPHPLYPARWRHRMSRSIRHLSRPGSAVPRLLDLGCGNGSFLSCMQQLGWEGFGLEPDQRAVRAARGAGLAVEQGVLTESTFPSGLFDAVTMNHVIEHLHEPVKMLQLCHRVLRPGGILWIATPNVASLGLARFGPAWRGLEPPRHLVLFTLGALQGALERAGFEPARAPLLGMGARWMYRASARLRLGDRPLSAVARLRAKSQALLDDRRTRRQPHFAEEIVLQARKR